MKSSRLLIDSNFLWLQSIAKRDFIENSKDFIDCGGTVWPQGTFPYIPLQTKLTKEFPEQGDGFRAGRIEWEALALAVYISVAPNFVRKQNSKAIMVELGASAAPWCLTFLKHVGSKADVFVETVAIEAGNVKKLTKFFWKQNFIDFRMRRFKNGFIFHGKRFKCTFLRGIASNTRGDVFFPKIDISKDNGATASRNLVDLDKRGKTRYEKITSFDIFEILGEFRNISLLHMDIQGAEVDLMLDKRFGLLVKNISILLIGTHSNEADNLAMSLDGQHELILLSSNAMKPTGPHGEWPVDGEFLFINKDLVENLLADRILIDEDPPSMSYK